MSSFSVAAGAVAPLMFFMVLGFCVSQKAHFDGTAIANFNKLSSRCSCRPICFQPCTFLIFLRSWIPGSFLMGQAES